MNTIDLVRVKVLLISTLLHMILSTAVNGGTTENCDCINSKMSSVTYDGESSIIKFPWMVSIHESIPAIIYGELIDSFICSASLISSKWIMTSAYCLDKYKHDPYEVIAILGNDNFFSEHITKEMVMLISGIKVHPSYKKDKYEYNIALAKIYYKANINNEIRPICLPIIQLDIRDATVALVGWTKMKNGMTNPYLQNTTLQVYTGVQCRNDRYSNYLRVTPRKWCLFGDLSEDICDYHEGGQIVYECFDHTFLIGVIPGNTCSKVDYLYNYVKVIDYLSWIHETTKITNCSPTCDQQRPTINNHRKNNYRPPNGNDRSDKLLLFINRILFSKNSEIRL